MCLSIIYVYSSLGVFVILRGIFKQTSIIGISYNAQNFIILLYDTITEITNDIR